MELYQLKTFACVAREGHLTRAAQRLSTSQPAVSAHIKALEEELDVTLFERTAKGMKLTPQGMLLKQRADRVLQAADDMRFTAHQFKEELTGGVRLGMHTDPQYLRATRILAEMKRDHPKVSLSFIPKMTWETAEELHAGRLDAAFAYARPEDDSISAHTLDQVGLVIVGPIAWQDRLENTTLADMAALPWIWTSQQCPFFKTAQQLIDDMGCEPNKAVTTDQEAAIRQMVAAGVGLSIMSEIEAIEAATAGELFIIGSSIASLDLSLLYLKKRAQDPLVRAIVASIAKAWQKDDLLAPSLADETESVA